MLDADWSHGTTGNTMSLLDTFTPILQVDMDLKQNTAAVIICTWFAPVKAGRSIFHPSQREERCNTSPERKETSSRRSSPPIWPKQSRWAQPCSFSVSPLKQVAGWDFCRSFTGNGSTEAILSGPHFLSCVPLYVAAIELEIIFMINALFSFRKWLHHAAALLLVPPHSEESDDTFDVTRIARSQNFFSFFFYPPYIDWSKAQL